MKTARIIALALLIFLIGCEELVTTQRPGNPPTVTFSKPSGELLADGEDNLKVTLDFVNKLSVQEVLTITLTNGHLVEIPSSNFGDGVSTLTVTPNSNKYEFYVVSSKEPDEDVLLGIGVAKTSLEKGLAYVRVCPDELLLDLSATSVSLSNLNPINATIDLRNINNAVSNGTRVELQIEPDSLATLSVNRVNYEGASVNFTITPTGSTGTAMILAYIRQNGCDSIVNSHSIIIKQ